MDAHFSIGSHENPKGRAVGLAPPPDLRMRRHFFL
jgi:hypothetical protein